jgi:hypothetical protein
MFDNCTFQIGGHCEWDGFEDTFRLLFREVKYPSTEAGAVATPESIGALFRRFLNPLYDESRLLSPASLGLIGHLLPDDCYVARWCQLSVFGSKDKAHFDDAMDKILSPGHHEKSEARYYHQGCTNSAPLLYCPRAPLPDSLTRNDVIKWAQNECEEAWYTPWQHCPRSDTSQQFEEEMVAKYGQLARPCYSAYLANQNCEPTSATPFLTPLQSFAERSYHWPNMHPLLPTQPSQKLNEATVLAYMDLLQKASAQHERPTVLLLEVKAHKHQETYFFVLDGHHKLEALQRLKSTVGLKNPRINFLIVSRFVKPELDWIATDQHFYDDFSGIKEHRGGRHLLVAARAAVEYDAALRTIHGCFQVASVVRKLVADVRRVEQERIKELRNEKLAIVEEIVSLRTGLRANGLAKSLPRVEWKRNKILDAKPKWTGTNWKEINEPRWHDLTLTELQKLRNGLREICTSNELGGLFLKFAEPDWKLPELQGSLNIFGGDADDY